MLFLLQPQKATDPNGLSRSWERTRAAFVTAVLVQHLTSSKMLNVSEHIYDIGTEVLIPIRHHFNGREFHNNLKLRSPAAGSIFSSKITSAIYHEGLVRPLLMFHFKSCFGGACEPKTRKSGDNSSPTHQGTVWIKVAFLLNLGQIC